MDQFIDLIKLSIVLSCTLIVLNKCHGKLQNRTELETAGDLIMGKLLFHRFCPLLLYHRNLSKSTADKMQHFVYLIITP